MSPPLDDANPQRPISSILFVMAMQAEALPLVEHLKLDQDDGSLFPAGLPWIRYHGRHEGLDVSVVVPGKCMVFGVDNVGTVPSALITYAAVQALHPDLIINMGTAGGFKGKGAKVADAYIATKAANHDRRIPIPIFDEYGIGENTTISTPNLVQTLQLKEGKLSTGNSLDMTPQDEQIIKSNDATIKDMEGAAVLYVAHLLSTPVILLKVITDIVDGDKPTAEEFLENLSNASLVLLQTSLQMLDFIKGKSLAEL
ncbi:hypothetical protein GOP47_0019631 [Adiantum capillus-veneris]|uniref:Nucleoside phosphorylase domain-containing protein n=1 Tax=Adiantum capillus-veneris TaxID=13818 RepID=A0A9D4UD49_ADICA|nr:hypothetical protein GOP47_0019631 [Adiantum capillus-veneris]